MQSRLQGLFLFILSQLYSLVNGVETGYIKGVIFTNKLKVPVDVTAYYHTAPVTEDNIRLAETKEEKALASGATHVFPSVTNKPLRVIKTNAGNNLAECNVHAQFAEENRIVDQQRLELLPSPEEEGTGTDSALGWVKNVHIKNSLLVTANVVAYYSTSVLATNQQGTPDTSRPVTSLSTTTFETKAGTDNYVRRLVVTASINNKDYTAVCNVQRRYGSDKVHTKYLEIVKDDTLDVVAVRPVTTGTGGYVHAANVRNLLKEQAEVKAYFSEAALNANDETGVEPTKKDITEGALETFPAQNSGGNNLPLRRIKSLAGGSPAKIDIDTRFGTVDKIEVKYLKIVYQAAPTS